MPLSDYNNSKSKNTSRSRLYSDISLAFPIHPNTQDLGALKDIDAVKNSVKNLVLTNFFERPFQPTIGSNITALLFEPADPFTQSAIRDEVYRVLREHESRVNGVSIEIVDNHDRNSYAVSIKFNVIFSNERQETNFYLERLR
jgi:phage baseplate assembly protein W